LTQNDTMAKLSAAAEAPVTMLKEFREFIARGNVIDLAVGVIIGGAFGKIVTSFVDDVVMPIVGIPLGKVDFTQLKIVLQPADPTHKVAEVALRYGAFLNTILQFLIVALVIFFMVKLLNAVRRQQAAEPATPPAPSPTEVLLGEIRDLLKARG
jgi:large conductance mechanosensitive channel